MNLKKLKNLKKVRINYFSDGTLNSLESESLQTLELKQFPEESLKNVAIHCPNLRELCFLSTSDEVTKIDKVLHHLPKIERIICSYKQLNKFQCCGHQNLKSLHVRDSSKKLRNWDNLSDFISRCQNFESLSINIKLKTKQLENLLSMSPRLKSLCLGEFSEGSFKIVRKYGKNLHCLHYTGWSMKHKKMRVSNLKKYFKDQFTLFTFRGAPDAHEEGLMRRTGSEEKCCKSWPMEQEKERWD